MDGEVALNEALRDLHMVVSEAGATVRHAPMPWVIADAVHLRQLFQNLVSNSLKYRRYDVPLQIDISAVRDGSHWVISVQDNGIGVAQEFHSRVFEPFKRLHGSDVTGAGIGLATCRRIVERYGGRIWLESAEGAGATFSFRLPAAEPE